MSSQQRRPAGVRVKLLVTLMVVAALLVVAAFVGRDVRRRIMVQSALAKGNAAYECGDWETAGEMLQRYLWVHQDDPDVLVKFAEAQLSVRPLPRENVRRAMAAYRRLLGIDPGNEAAFKRLALLYETVGDSANLRYIANRRLKAVPDDPPAILAEAKALLYLQKPEEARAKLEELVGKLAEQSEKRPEFVEACILLSSLAVQTVSPGGDPAREEEARAWLNRAAEYSPDSGLALLARAALPRVLAERTLREVGEAELAAARTDLERAEKLDTVQPQVRLVLSEEWMAHRALDRAAAQLEEAKEIDPTALREFIIDPSDWIAAQFMQAGKLSLLTGAAAEGVKLAREALDQLEDRPQRLQILPMTVELFVASDRVADARQSLDEYLNGVKELQNTPERDAAVAFLKAIVVRAEDQPYRVIELLGPFADGLANERASALLAEAYMQTGQLSRSVQVLSEVAAERGLSPGMARLLGRLHIRQGAWAEARDVLRWLEQAQGEDVDTRILRLASELVLTYEERSPSQTAFEALTDELTALRKAHPQQVTIRVLLAAIAERQGRLEAAEAELKRAIADCDNPHLAMLPLATLYADSQRPTEALEVLHLACEQHGASASPWLALAELLVNQQRIDEARAELRRGLEAITAADERTRVAIRLAFVDLLHGDRATGLASLREIAARDPQDVRARDLLLRLPEVHGDAAGAAQLLDEIKRVEGESGLLGRINQARLWLADNDWRTKQDDIEELLKYCIDADPGWPEPVLLLGQMYERLLEYANAEATYSNGFKLTEATEVADRLLTLLLKQNRFAEARDLLQRLNQKLDERAAGARRVLLAMGAGEYGEAIRELEIRIASERKDASDLLSLARAVYLQHRDADRALEYLRQAAALTPDVTAAVAMQVYVLQEEGRLDEAAALLNDLVTEKPTPRAYSLRASYFASVGQAELAEKDYIEMARIAEDDFGPAVLGEYYAQTNRLDDAIRTWEQGFQSYPDSQTLKRGLAKALLTRGQPGDQERAGQFVAQLRETLPDDTDLLWVQAVAELGEGKPEKRDEIRELLRKAVRSSPAKTETYRGLIGLAFQLQEYPTARELALRGLQANPGDTDLLLLRAQAELALGDFDAAHGAADRVLAGDPKNAAALEVVLEAAARRQDAAALERALETVRQLISDEPDSEALQLLLARIHVALGQDDLATAGLVGFCASDTGAQSVPALLLLQDIHRANGDLEAARQRLEAAAGLGPDHPGVLRGRLLLLAAEERFDDIVTLVEGDIAGGNPQPDVLLFAASLLETSPRHLDTAIELCERATEMAPDYEPAYASLALYAYRKGDVTRAVEVYRTLLGLSPSHPDALNNLAWILEEQGSADEEALGYARQAVSRRPGDANFRNTLAVVLKSLGRLEEARDEFRRSVELAAPGSALRAKSLFHLGQVCCELKDWATIRAYASDLKALRADTGGSIFNERERAELDRLLQAMQQTE